MGNLENKKLILDVKIDMDGPAYQMKGKNCEVLMIPFKGSATGEIFNGIVEPCGVDTQVVNAANVRHMSARYMLTGKDSTGADAHIYVENNGWFKDGDVNMPFNTVPTFLTDSEALAGYLHTNQFIGEGIVIENQLHIRFYEV
ncbi:MAG: DUF3237 domain-containing protein [Butyrivibrio sp.]|nr:DUF3237 domain-containing protein [Butyrivibrio sp.]